ncbi:MAG: hypothetical protein ACI9NQ_001049 [Paracoccaceae bacterium]|jgi:hypothetical protein
MAVEGGFSFSIDEEVRSERWNEDAAREEAGL